MAWRGSFSRTLLSTARSASVRRPPATPLPRLRPPSAPRLRHFTNPRNLGELGCTQSFLPLTIAGSTLTSHIMINARAFCELSHGT